MSRLITDLKPEAQMLYYKFERDMHEKAIDFIVTCTIRTAAEQLELWKKGRVEEHGGWRIIDPKKCVTWSFKSRHQGGTAFDIAILIAGKILWNPSLDADGDGVSEYTEAGLVGESVGLRWGGRFKSIDACHFELQG